MEGLRSKQPERSEDAERERALEQPTPAGTKWPTGYRQKFSDRVKIKKPTTPIGMLTELNKNQQIPLTENAAHGNTDRKDGCTSIRH